VAYPVYEDNGGIGASSDAAVDVPYPATVNENDILIVTVGDEDNDTFSTPSGWNAVDSFSAVSIFSSAWFWMRAAGTESGSETFTSASSDGSCVAGLMFRFSGCATGGDPYEANTSASDLAAPLTDNPTVSEITTLGPERLCCCLPATEDNRTFSGGTNYSVVAQDSTAQGNDMAFGLATYQKAAAGVVSSETISIDQTEAWTTFTFALLPVPAVVVQEALHTHAADNLVIVFDLGPITIQDALHDHSAENLVVPFSAGEAVVSDGTHAHAADNLVVPFSAGLIVVADALSAHSADNLVLVPHTVAVIQDVLHGHSADSLAMEFSGGGLFGSGISSRRIIEIWRVRTQQLI
jgi:hypothetical protein